MRKKELHHKRKIKREQQRRYRATHKEHEAAKEFKRGQTQPLRFLYLLWKSLKQFSATHGIFFMPWKEFKLEGDRYEFKRLFLTWKQSGNNEVLKPSVHMGNFKNGFMKDNLIWNTIPSSHIQNKKEVLNLNDLSDKMDKRKIVLNVASPEEERKMIEGMRAIKQKINH